MRHKKRHGMKLGTDASHTKAMKRSLVCALLENDRIKTTLPKAKAIRRDVDHVITLAKTGTLHARRLAIAAINNKELVRETFEKAEQGMWKDRNGGYTRIMKLGKRKGDNAEVAIIELVQEAVAPAPKNAPKVEKVASKKAAPKAEKTEKAEPKAEAKADAKKADAPKEEKAAKAEKAEKPEAKKEETAEPKAPEAKEEPKKDEA